MSLLNRGLILLIIISAMTGCASGKKQTQSSIYFRDLNDSLLNQSAVEYEPVFQKGDILSIAVITPNETSARLFNQHSTSTPAEGQAASSAAQGYLVDESGKITLPYVGAVSAAGLTRTSLTDVIAGKLQQYVDSPIVSVRLLNYRITVLGEVNKPGTFSIPSERVTVLDAIGLAGDLTVYGQRRNIRVIRTSGGSRQTGTLDLNKGDIFSSPYFYLRQNDIVYIEMNERKIPNSDQASLRNVSIALGIISALGVVISTINVLR